ncbi:putative RNA splicing protein [Lyophyllum shimeji]|uniref:RNA splicing protein n=1 Tax=Lyophyllum shimeji TaxID=47721 RepID=A0A9P3PD93_LYOSH|nr:putative RNA splicing protein [Lyophyllum shimeji]
MPKVVSRSAVSSSTDVQPTASSAADLRVYYCICGEFILVIDKSLATLPRRKTDNAIIMRTQDSDAGNARVFKLNAVAGEPILLERQGGHECQYRFHCPRCSLPIGYQSSPPPVKSAPFFYILAGALTQHQGQIPPGALDEELPKTSG